MYKETVMSEEQIMELEPRFKEMDSFVCDGTDFDKVAKAQAEISFKAGIKEGIEYVVSGKYMECENLKELSSD